MAVPKAREKREMEKRVSEFQNGFFRFGFTEIHVSKITELQNFILKFVGDQRWYQRPSFVE